MFTYENNQLCATQFINKKPEISNKKSFNLTKFAKDKEHPFYIYNLDYISDRYKKLKRSFENISLSTHFAIKSNNNKNVLKNFISLGSGFDVVSGGELSLMLKYGASANSIIFSGVGKSKQEILLAIQSNIKQINIESFSELKRITSIAKEIQMRANIALRVNPNINPETHPYITTGLKENKFGIEENSLREISNWIKDNSSQLNLKGLTMHIGSQITSLEPISNAIDKLKNIHLDFIKKGFELTTINIGGGLGMDYSSDDISSEEELIESYGALASNKLRDLNVEVLIEPGRILVARSGALVTTVQYIKQTSYKNFIIADTGMHHFMRPSLYQASHRIVPLINYPKRKKLLYDIVGPICESSDFIGKDRYMTEVQELDKLAILDTGAYGHVMSNNYNLHSESEEIVISNNEVLV